MITFVNEDLFNFSVSEETSKMNPSQTFFKMKVFTTSKLVRNNESSIQNNVEPYVPVAREIVSIIAPSQDFNLYNHSINVSPHNSNYVTIKSHHKGATNYDRNYFLVAIPFSGAMKPIPQSRDYSIYKGVVASSCRPFWFNGAKFRKILYLVIEPNSNAFFNVTEGKKPGITITVEAVSNYRDRQDGGKEKANKFTQTITLRYDSTLPEGTYPIVATYEQNKEDYDHPLRMDRHDQPLWVTHNAPQFNGQKKPYEARKPYTPKPFGSKPQGDRPNKPYHKDNTPKPNNKPVAQSTTEKEGPDAIESMIAASGMRDTSKMYRQAQYDRKKKKKR